MDHIHIKDRLLGGGTVSLGSGDTDFPTVFQEMAAMDYSGILILQTARDKNEIALARNNMEFVESAWQSAYHKGNGCSA
jgi:hexulose-6-phosphate isomerase